jgi:hypothetical protein
LIHFDTQEEFTEENITKVIGAQVNTVSTKV